MTELTIAGSGSATKNEIRDVVNGNTFTVGDGGRFATVQAAIDHIATLPSKIRDVDGLAEDAGTVAVAAHSSTIVGTSTGFNWFTSSMGAVEFNNNGAFYAVKRVYSDTGAEIYGGVFAGIAAGSTVKFYAMIPYVIKILGLVSYGADSDIDFTALANYSITLSGNGVDASVLEFEPSMGSSYGLDLRGTFITLTNFTLRNRRQNAVASIKGGGGLLTVRNIRTAGSGTPAVNFKVGVSGLIIDGFDATHSEKGPDSFIVNGYAMINGFRNHNLNIDEALQITTTSDNGHEQPFIINSPVIQSDVANTGFGCIHVSLAAAADEDKRVHIHNPMIINTNAAHTGSAIQIEQGRTPEVPSGAGTVKAWITSGQLNAVAGSVNSIGILARYNADIIHSGVYNNATTPTSALNGATITAA